MDASRDRAAPEDRVVVIRADIEAARGRIVTTLAALRHKVDVPGRLGDLVGAAAGEFIAHMIDRAMPASDEEAAVLEATAPMASETDVPGGPRTSRLNGSGRS
jgi:Protein of unknown function (DUF3618)